MVLPKENNKTKQYKPTGINLIDNLTPAERTELRIKLQRHFDSLSSAEKQEHMALVHDMVRRKMVEHHGHISKQDCIREFLNRDFPRIIADTADDIQEEALKTGNIGYARISEIIRRTKWGIDKFDITLNKVEKDSDVGVGSYEARDKEE